MLGKAAVDAVRFLIRRANFAADIAAVDFNDARQLCVLGFIGQRLADFMRKHESRFVLHAHVAAKLDRGNAFRSVRNDADRGEHIDERELAAREDRSRRNRELMRARLALELAAGGDVVGLAATAARANRLAVRLRPAQGAEFAVSGFLARLVDVFQLQRAGSGGEEKVLRHWYCFRCLVHRM